MGVFQGIEGCIIWYFCPIKLCSAIKVVFVQHNLDTE